MNTPFYASMLYMRAVEHGGFTFSPQWRTEPTQGYVVGMADRSAERHVLLADRRAAERAIEQTIANAAHCGALAGGWVQDDLLILECSILCLDLTEAVKIGQENGQYAIWDLTNQTEIPLTNNEREYAAIAAEMVEASHA